MYSINTIEGLLFRSYLCFYNLSLIHKYIKAGDDDYRNEVFKKASLSVSNYDFEQKIDRAMKQTESYLQYCNKNKIRILHYRDKNYPGELLRLKDFPPLLFVKGNLSLKKCVAVVGTRKPSLLANDKVDHVVKAFAEKGYSIVSGLALGIDSLAHKAALNNKLFTAAVLPVSFNIISPVQNIDLANCIVDAGGVLITEQAPGYIAVANAFVMRNRIIAALCDYLIPIEMGIDSGTRHAVNYAVRYNKKLILCKPNYYELDHYIRHYEGIIVAIKKYKGKENVSLISDLAQLSSCIDNDQQQQLKLI